jgi:hypothetical protein
VGAKKNGNQRCELIYATRIKKERAEGISARKCRIQPVE